MRRVQALHAFGLHHDSTSPGGDGVDVLRRFMNRRSSVAAAGPVDDAPPADEALSFVGAAVPVDDAPPADAELSSVDAAGPVDDAPPADAAMRSASTQAG